MPLREGNSVVTAVVGSELKAELAKAAKAHKSSMSKTVANILGAYVLEKAGVMTPEGARAVGLGLAEMPADDLRGEVE